MGIATDNSITDPRQVRDIEQAIIHDGKPIPKLRVRFFEHAAKDAAAEARQRDRIEAGSGEVARPYFKRALYIEKRHEDQKDYITKPATERDKREFRDAFEAFEAQKDQPKKHSIQLLPGADVVAQAIFNELNLLYIEDFLEFSEAKPEILDIFDELRPLLEVAKRWRTFMKPRLKLVNGKIENGDD